MSKDALDHIELMPFTISQIDLPRRPRFILLNGDRVYTAVRKTLYVYLIREPTDPIATYSLEDRWYLPLFVENRFYLCSGDNLLVFEVTPSLTCPLIEISEIKIKDYVKIMVRKGHELLLCGYDGWFQVFNMSSDTITHTHTL